MIDISIEELVKLKEQGMTDKRIAEHLAKRGIKVSITTVNIRLSKYYRKTGKVKPRGRDIQDEELVTLKEDKKSDREIAEYFTNQGRKICLASVNTRLNKHYKSKKTDKPKVKRDNPVKQEINNEEILELRNKGMSLRKIAEYFRTLGKNISHVAINNRIKRNNLDSLESENPNEEESKEFKDSLKVTTVMTSKEEKTNNIIKSIEEEER